MKKSEIILITILVVLLCGVGYYFFYFIPTGERIAELEASVSQKSEDVDFAAQRILIWSALTAAKEQNASAWEEFDKVAPEKFDDADALSLIQKIIYPYTRDVAVRFPESTAPMEETTVHTAEVSLSVSYDTLQSILRDFAAEDIANRILYINCSRRQTGVSDYMATGASTAPPEYLLTVNMAIEFLSRRP